MQLGREVLSWPDRKVSRNHCIIHLQNDGGLCNLSLSVCGRNPVQVQRDDTSVLLVKGEDYKLKTNDVISLLPGVHLYRVVISSAPNNSPQKRKRTGSFEEDPNVTEDDQNNKPKKKKPKHIEIKDITVTNIEEDYQFALRLQNEPSFSEVPQNNSNVKDTKNLEEIDRKLALSLQPRECTLCLDEIEIDFFQALDCGHEFCRDCLEQYFVTAISSKKFPLVCPDQRCKKEVNDLDLRLILKTQELEKYENFSLSLFIEKNGSSYSCCPTANCPYLFFFKLGDYDFNCPKCTKRYCLSCKVDYHSGVTCKDYQKWRVVNGKADELFDKFVYGTKCKQCPGCKKWVKKKRWVRPHHMHLSV